MINVIFIEEHMKKLLDEIRMPITYLIESKVDSEHENGDYISKLKTRIGNYDFKNLVEVDNVLNRITLGKDYPLLDRVTEKINSWVNNDEVLNKIHNQLLLKDKEGLEFNDTYDIMVTIESNFIITIKPGFTNFINDNRNNVYRKQFLEEIIDMVPKNVLFGEGGVALLNSYNKL